MLELSTESVLIINEEKTKEIITLKEGWIRDHKIRWTFALNLKMLWEVISNARNSVSSDFQTLRSWLKKLDCASYFQPTSQCLDIWWNTLPRVWYTVTWNAESNEWTECDHHSTTECCLGSSEKSRKNSGLNGDSIPNPCDAGAALHQLSYQAQWEQVVMRVIYKSVDMEIADDNTSSCIWNAEWNECDHRISSAAQAALQMRWSHSFIQYLHLPFKIRSDFYEIVLDMRSDVALSCDSFYLTGTLTKLNNALIW